MGLLIGKMDKKLLDDHANYVLHNKARKDYECYKNQRQSVSHVISRGSQKEEEEYSDYSLYWEL